MKNPMSVVGKTVEVDVQDGPDRVIDSFRGKVIRFDGEQDGVNYYDEVVVEYRGKFYLLFDGMSGWTIDIRDVPKYNPQAPGYRGKGRRGSQEWELVTVWTNPNDMKVERFFSFYDAAKEAEEAYEREGFYGCLILKRGTAMSRHLKYQIMEMQG